MLIEHLKSIDRQHKKENRRNMAINLIKTTCVKHIFSLIITITILAGYSLCGAADNTVFSGRFLNKDKTALLFVGEDVNMITIASKRAESPASAPAIALVFPDKKFKKYDIQTLSEALQMTDGFFITRREWGSQPFFRGVEEGVLFLYDSVPLTSDATKSIHPLDEELSAFFVKKLEIIKGPGSIIWGPDAFAGIVNIVPKRGRDIEGIKFHLIHSMPYGKRSLDIAVGKNFGLWEGLLGLSLSSTRDDKRRYNIVRFQEEGSDTPIPPAERIGTEKIDDSNNLEFILNLSWKDWLHISGRWAEMEKNYVLNELKDNISWSGQRKTPFRFLKAEADLPVSSLTTLKLNGYINELKLYQEEIDLSWEQTSRIYHGEALLEREFINHSCLVTIGGSFRENKITGAVISKSFIPDYLHPDNALFVPQIDQKDFNTSLKSLFLQARKHWQLFDIWAGLRVDDHSQYNITWSHNAGAAYHPTNSWYMKLLYGSAFRTPYNQQLIGRSELDPESIKNVSLNMHWAPNGLSYLATKDLEGDLTIYWNRLRHHVKEDPYAGLSNPGRGDIWGMELEAKVKPKKFFTIWANSSLNYYTGDKDSFKVLEYVFIRPDGSFIPYYSAWESPFEKGPGLLSRIGATISFNDTWELSGVAAYNSPWWVTYKKGETVKKIDPTFNVDITLRARGLFTKTNLTFSIKNLFDEKECLPGRYGDFKSSGIRLFAGIEMQY